MVFFLHYTISPYPFFPRKGKECDIFPKSLRYEFATYRQEMRFNMVEIAVIQAACWIINISFSYRTR